MSSTFINEEYVTKLEAELVELRTILSMSKPLSLLRKRNQRLKADLDKLLVVCKHLVAFNKLRVEVRPDPGDVETAFSKLLNEAVEQVKKEGK